MDEQLPENETVFEISQAPIYLSSLELCPGFLIHFDRSPPNRWIQFWHLVFFGFKWTEIKE